MLIAYHDLSIWNWPLVECELRLLRSWGVSSCALGVIPAMEDFSASQQEVFRQRLQQWQADGYEMLLHGWKHRMAEGGSWVRRWVGRITQQEAEFAGVSTVEARELMAGAVEAWSLLGLPFPQVFIPPTWWISRKVPEVVFQQNLQMLETRYRLISHTGRSVGSVPWSRAGIPPWLQSCNTLAFDLLRHWPGVPRLVFHPGDLSGASQQQSYQMLMRSLHWGQRIRYEDLNP